MHAVSEVPRPVWSAPAPRAISRWALVAGPAALLLVLVGVLAVSHGGFATTVWYPAALGCLALLVVTLLLAPPRTRERSRLVEGASALYLAFCAFSYLSALWAHVPGQTWDAANRSLLYGLVFVLVALRPWPREVARAALVAVVAIVVGVALGTLVASVHGDPARLFLGGRLSEPFGYANATADFWLIGLWPALWLAVDPKLTWALRGPALAAAGILLEMTLLSQSRGALIGLVATAVLFVAFTSRRWATVAAFVACAVPAAVSFSVLTDIRNVHLASGIAPAMTEVRRAVVLGALALLLVGWLLAIIDRRAIWPWLRDRRGLRRAADLVLAGLVAAAVVGGLLATGDPVHWARARYQDFKASGYTKVESGANRFTGGLGSNRYDFYRVATNEFSAHPVGGIGAENFAGPYLRERHSPETPNYAHSFAFSTLAGLGVVGTALFAGFLTLALTAAARGARRSGATGRGLTVAAAAGFGVFFIHGLADWLWQFPALGVLAFGLLGLSVRVSEPGVGADAASLDVGQRMVDHGSPARARWGALARRSATAVLALAAAVSLALPGIAARLSESANRVSATHPAVALQRLRQAARLNFMRADAPLDSGVIAEALGDNRTAATDFRWALRREPENWYAQLQLAILSTNTGARQDAMRALTSATRLNPHQPVLGALRSQMASGRHIDPGEVDNELNAQFVARLSPTG